jgi:hypothetical protein
MKNLSEQFRPGNIDRAYFHRAKNASENGWQERADSIQFLVRCNDKPYPGTAAVSPTTGFLLDGLPAPVRLVIAELRCSLELSLDGTF